MNEKNLRTPGTSLAKAIQTLRSELLEALDDAEKYPLNFELESIELELQVTVSHTSERGGKLTFWVVELGGKGTHAGQAVHTVSLKLKPKLTDVAGPVLIADQEAGPVR